MYAVIKTGGKQYRVTEGMNLKVEKLEGDIGAKLSLDEVLMVGGDGEPKIGTPLVSGVAVAAEVVKQAKDKKILVYKKERRKGYEKKYGHRQQYTELKITKINA
ncbi:MAG: 50S ribosomal protein L21 [Pseudomonadota bacterium]